MIKKEIIYVPGDVENELTQSKFRCSLIDYTIGELTILSAHAEVYPYENRTVYIVTHFIQQPFGNDEKYILIETSDWTKALDIFNDAKELLEREYEGE